MNTILVRFVSAIIIAMACATSAVSAEWTLDKVVGKDDHSRPVYHARPVDEKFRNEWPEEYEREFQQRCRTVIAGQSNRRVARGNTYFENEKRTYGYLMAQALGDRGMEAVGDLQVEDAQADQWHRQTRGIDFYAAFTLKHQMRKYFYFGDLLEPDYRRRMFEGAKKWTESDPLRRPHQAYRGAKLGWGPDAKNSWVDVRSTENLFLMRVTSVYLMAEETGNRATAEKYKQIILNYAQTLYRIGMGEWDSENYHGHSLAPLANLYDFAKDEDVKLVAKACLDWMFAAGAVKYYRGGFNGPSKRDYNHPQPFGGSAPSMLWVFFGDAPRANDHWESDEVHLITSAYRPPVAVMKLARKQFDRPVELLAGKPRYNATTTFDADSQPRYLETQYIGNSFLMGSLPGGTRPGASDVNGFKILVYDSEHGALALQAVPGPDPNFPGSPLYQHGKVSAENRVGQYENLAIWLVRDGQSPWRWVVPDSVQVSRTQEVTFLRCDQTWVALRPLGTSPIQPDDGLTRKVADGEKARFPHHQVLAAGGRSKRFCGLAVEVGERQTHGSFARFRQDVLAADVDESKLDDGIVQYKAADGKWLGFHWNQDPHNLGVWRNGQRYDWKQHAEFLYGSQAPASRSAPIYSKWGEGILTVRADGSLFRCAVDDHGRVTFENR